MPKQDDQTPLPYHDSEVQDDLSATSDDEVSADE